MFGGIGFDRSKYVMDSGLLGVCGLLGCCGSRKKRRSRRHSHNRQEIQAPRDSDLSSYLPPAGGVTNNGGTATRPGFPQSRQGSGNSQPPSVLKPEHANRPYKELVVDNDDNGYIMGAWRPSPRPSSGYIPVSDGPQTTAPGTFVLQPPPKAKPSSPIGSPAASGFSRIGGGRAHIDTPYAIATGSTHTFPSIGHQSLKQSSLNQSSSALVSQPQDTEDDLPLSFSNVESGTAFGNSGLPPGAMQPAHIRTKSQSAIVENYLPLGSGSGSGPSQLVKQYQALQPPLRQRQLSQDNFLRPPGEIVPMNRFMFGGGSDPDDDDSGDEQDQQKKKKPWYHLRGPRLHSAEGRTSTSASATDLKGIADGEMGGLDPSDSKQQRSFVVIRKPASSMGRLNQASSSANATYPMDVSRPPTR